jgi:hypothetical protein
MTTRGPVEWRQAMLAYHGAGMTEGVRVLLLVMAEKMDVRRCVSVPRAALARMLAVDVRRVTERVQIAHELGLLDTVQRGRPGVTATYQGLFPTGAHVRTKTRRDSAAVRTTEHSAVERTIKTAQHGAHVRPASSRRNSAESYGSQPADTVEKARAPKREEGQPTSEAPGSPSRQRFSLESLPPPEPHGSPKATVAGFVTEPQRECRRCSGALVGHVQQASGLCGVHWMAEQEMSA